VGGWIISHHRQEKIKMKNEQFPNNNESEHQAILTHDEMENVTGGTLQVPPFHGGPVPLPTLPVIPVPTV
jgi:hypothetical protein